MHLPPIRQLQYLIALGDTLHFGKAAESLHVTQSTLSTGIKELENTLGVTLVERSKKSVAFTEVGRALLENCRKILIQYESLVNQAREFQDPLHIPFRIGAIPTIAPYLMADFVARVRKKLPDIKLYIRENTTGNLLLELNDGKLDLILIAFPYDTENLETRIMYREGLHLVHSSAEKTVKGTSIDFNQIPNESLLLLDDGHCLRDHALSGCKLKSDKKIHTFGANSLQMLIQMVDNNLGMTFVPDMAINAGVLERTQTRTVRLPATQFYRDIGFAWRKDNYRHNKLLELISCLTGKTSQKGNQKQLP
ncbi:MAG: hydrogen peroxide-inducible genes activator [Gammaproteobacteria bacterium]|nr:hydrogen peroxide-inducible genes activator [Gammaproteobacteria bacterium]